MDPSSSSVGFPLSGNTQFSQNSTPLPSSGEFPPSENTQSSEISLPLPSSSVAIPSSEMPLSTQNPQSNLEQQLDSNEPPMLIFSSADWNRELGILFPDLNFCSFMRRGPCRDDFLQWYVCMFGAVYIGANRVNCTRWAGVLRDCIFADPNYYHPLIMYLLDRNPRW